MMKFTNPDDLAATSNRMKLSGWYAQDSAGDFLGVLRETDGIWYVGFTESSDVTYPITVDRIPR